MELSRSQETILYQLKVRGSQSVKILANRLKITTMGTRQHLEDLQLKGLVGQTRVEKQTRGRPVHHWKLTATGHQHFPNSHEEVTTDLIKLIHEKMGNETLNTLIDARDDAAYSRYDTVLAGKDQDLQGKLETIAGLRSEEGFMAEIRLLPDRSWLLIENHCPIYAAAQTCNQFCQSELGLFKRLLAKLATIERTDYLLEGARRCAYKISPIKNL